MAMRGRAQHKNHNRTLYIYRVIMFFIMDACPTLRTEKKHVYRRQLCLFFATK